MAELPQSTIEAMARDTHARYAFFRDPYAVSEKSPIRSELSLDELVQVQRFALQAALDEGGVVLTSEAMSKDGARALMDEQLRLMNAYMGSQNALHDLRGAAQAVVDKLGHEPGGILHTHGQPLELEVMERLRRELER